MSCRIKEASTILGVKMPTLFYYIEKGMPHERIQKLAFERDRDERIYIDVKAARKWIKAFQKTKRKRLIESCRHKPKKIIESRKEKPQTQDRGKTIKNMIIIFEHDYECAKRGVELAEYKSPAWQYYSLVLQNVREGIEILRNL